MPKLVASFVLAILLAGCAAAPPVQAMSDARQAIAAAREAGAEEFAAVELDAALRLLESAEASLQSGNPTGYWSAERDAVTAKETAFKALLKSRDARDAAAAHEGEL